jgi:hypothetical protein
LKRLKHFAKNENYFRGVRVVRFVHGADRGADGRHVSSASIGAVDQLIGDVEQRDDPGCAVET